MTKVYKNDLGVEYKELSELEQIELINKFQKLKKQLWENFILIIIIFGLMVISEKINKNSIFDFKIPIGFWMLLFFVAVINFIIFGLSKYKCPRCHQTPLDDSNISSSGSDISYNSGMIALSPKRCRKCGAYLSEKAWK